eukprot:7379643-Prymnesium_polylepis.1
MGRGVRSARRPPGTAVCDVEGVIYDRDRKVSDLVGGRRGIDGRPLGADGVIAGCCEAEV